MASTLWLCLGILSPLYLYLVFYRLKRLRLLSQYAYRSLFIASALFTGMFYLGHLISGAAGIIVGAAPFLAATFLHAGEPIHHVGYLLAPAALAITFLVSCLSASRS